MGLVGRVVDPPILALVDIYKHKLTGDIQRLQVGSSAPASIHYGVFPGALGVKVGVVPAKHGGFLLAVSGLEGKVGLFQRSKCPR